MGRALAYRCYAQKSIELASALVVPRERQALHHMAQVAVRGFRASVGRRLLCFALFWHALDIIWVWLFTVVYLMGVRP